MKSVSSRIARHISLGLFLLALCLGCVGGPKVVEEELPETKARLMAIQAAYSACTDEYRRPPRNKSELLRFLKSDDADEALKSPRDGQPFVICYGFDLYQADWAAAGKLGIVIYEKQGSNGTRWTVAVPGFIDELEEQQFLQSSFPPGHKVQK